MPYWIRISVAFDHDDKVRRAGFCGASVYLFILRLHGRLYGANGTGIISALHVTHESIATELQVPAKWVSEGLRKAEEAGLIHRDDCENLVINSWNKWQPGSDPERNPVHTPPPKPTTVPSTAHSTCAVPRTTTEQRDRARAPDPDPDPDPIPDHQYTKDVYSARNGTDPPPEDKIRLRSILCIEDPDPARARDPSTTTPIARTTGTPEERAELMRIANDAALPEAVRAFAKLGLEHAGGGDVGALVAQLAGHAGGVKP